MRKRIRFVKVTNSPTKAKEVLVGGDFGNPAVLRHSVAYDLFKRQGVKVPMNFGKATFTSIANSLMLLFPLSWKDRYIRASEEVDKEANRRRVYMVKNKVVTSRKGYVTQALKG